MRTTLEFQLFSLCLVLAVITCLSAESSTCLMVYKEGGAPAVFKSPKCPRWKLPDYKSPPENSRCQVSVHQGRRNSQEDRILCALDLRIPFPGPGGFIEVPVGIVAVFDGHNGSEASDMASKLLLEYLVLHTYFLLDAAFPSFLKKSMGILSNKEVVTLSSQFFKDREWILHFINQERHMSQELFGELFHLEILKEALLRTIADVDTTFSKEAHRFNLNSGSTATIVLIIDGQILVANLGDSKALLCSEQYQSPADAQATAIRMYRHKKRDGAVLRFKDCESCKMVNSKGFKHLVVRELTRDHRPDRDDEKFRVEKAGGYVIEWSGVPRVNGRLAVSRAIGDVSYKSYGVIAAPEIAGWQLLNDNDSYLVAASDGVFEGVDLQDVCDLLWEVQNDDDPSRSQLSSVCSESLADCIINTAVERGSTDNMAVAVVPLRLTSSSKTSLNSEEVPISLVQVEHANPIVAKFDRLLVDGKLGNFGCYYLYESLKEYEDTLIHPEDDISEDFYDIPYALPGHLDHSCGESLTLNENNVCFHFGMITDGTRDESRYPEDLSSFLALLESIPLQHAESSFGSFEHSKPDLRYILRKRFVQGAYGEVWLAFQWNCSQGDNAHNWNQNNITSSRHCLNLDFWSRVMKIQEASHQVMIVKVAPLMLTCSF